MLKKNHLLNRVYLFSLYNKSIEYLGLESIQPFEWFLKSEVLTCSNDELDELNKIAQSDLANTTDK